MFSTLSRQERLGVKVPCCSCTAMNSTSRESEKINTLSRTSSDVSMIATSDRPGTASTPPHPWTLQKKKEMGKRFKHLTCSACPKYLRLADTTPTSRKGAGECKAPVTVGSCVAVYVPNIRGLYRKPTFTRVECLPGPLPSTLFSHFKRYSTTRDHKWSSREPANNRKAVPSWRRRMSSFDLFGASRSQTFFQMARALCQRKHLPQLSKSCPRTFTVKSLPPRGKLRPRRKHIFILPLEFPPGAQA